MYASGETPLKHDLVCIADDDSGVEGRVLALRDGRALVEWWLWGNGQFTRIAIERLELLARRN